MKSAPNKSDIKRIEQLYSIGIPAHEIAKELQISQEQIVAHAPPAELDDINRNIIDIQKELDDLNSGLSTATKGVLNAQKCLPDLVTYKSNIEAEISRFKLLLTRTKDDLKSSKKRLKTGQDAVSDAQDKQLVVQQRIIKLKERMEVAEGELSDYHSKAKEEQRIAGLDAQKQRQALTLASMAIETTVGDKIAQIIKEKL